MAAWFDENILRPEVAGIMGSIIGLFNAPGLSWRERFFNLAAGVGCAFFVAPGLGDYLGIATKNGAMVVAFVVGLVGMNLASKVIDYVRRASLPSLMNFRNPPPQPEVPTRPGPLTPKEPKE